MFGFEAQTTAQCIGMAAFTRDFAVEEIARIELDRGFCGQYFHDAAAARLGENGGLFQRSGWIGEYPTVVVSESEADLLIRFLVNFSTNALVFGKIKHGSGHGLSNTSRN